MVSKKTKIAKMFHTDKEYAEYLISEALKKKATESIYKRIAHKFFIHTWKKVERSSFLSVNKCKFCGEFQCVSETNGRGVIYSLISIVTGGVLLCIGVLIHPLVLRPGIIVTGIICIWNFIKRTCEYVWKDTE